MSHDIKRDGDLITPTCPHCGHGNQHWAGGQREFITRKRRCKICKKYSEVYFYKLYVANPAEVSSQTRGGKAK